MAIRKTVVCDVDGSDIGVQKYRVGVAGGSLYVMELCEACAKPVNDLIKNHQETNRRATFKVTPMTEVARAPRTAQKRTGGTTARAPRKRG